MRPEDKVSGSAKIILRLLREYPDGLDIAQIRQLGEFDGAHQQLDRRLRELDPFYLIRRKRVGKRCVYQFERQRLEDEYRYAKVDKKSHAEVLAKANGRCRMCGRTIAEDEIKLHVDHKIPQDWGGSDEIDNLQALCSACNEGKKNYFSTFDSELMKQVMSHKRVHKRIAELLRIRLGEWVDMDLIEFVANAPEYQDDWQKRLRELRYFDLDIDVTRRKEGRRSVSYYRLNEWKELPEDPSQAAREYERRRAVDNRKKGNAETP